MITMGNHVREYYIKYSYIIIWLIVLALKSIIVFIDSNSE